MYYVVISRHCANMQQELAAALYGRKDIRVILDRRYGERRLENKPTALDRRRRDRRKSNRGPLTD